MTQKSSELLRMERDMSEHPELREELDAEIKRIAGAGEAASDGEALVKAAAALGYTVTVEELERTAADLEKLDDNELDAAAGGKDLNYNDVEKDEKYARETCGHYYRADRSKDEHGRDGNCLLSWHCLVTVLHTKTESKDVRCLSDYACALIRR